MVQYHAKTANAWAGNAMSSPETVRSYTTHGTVTHPGTTKLRENWPRLTQPRGLASLECPDRKNP